MRFELWSRDEYGQGMILGRYDDIEVLRKEAKKQVSNMNVDNPLTNDEKQNNWEAVWVDFIYNGKASKKVIDSLSDEDKEFYNNSGIILKQNCFYTGVSLSRTHDCAEVKKGKLEKNTIDGNVLFYLGNMSGSSWYLKNVRNGEYITSFEDLQKMNVNISEKTIIFAKAI